MKHSRAARCVRAFKIFMNELKDTILKRPMENVGSDAAALRGLVEFMNSPINDPAYDPSKPRKIIAPPIEEPSPEPVLPPPPALPIITPPTPRPALFTGAKICYTGSLAAGKDYIANATGAEIFGMAAPLYTIASHFFGVEVTATKNKDLPGMRAFLQMVGQWGRNVLNEQYPVTPARACFVTMIRSLGALGKFPASLLVNWDDYGKADGIWIEALVRRAENFLENFPERKIAVTNTRFDVEFKTLTGNGFTHFHIMTSPATWSTRLAAKKLTPQSKELQDISEHMATSMNRGVLQQISREPRGPKIRCIWNDNSPPPSPRLFTVKEFLQEMAIAELPVSLE